MHRPRFAGQARGRPRAFNDTHWYEMSGRPASQYAMEEIETSRLERRGLKRVQADELLLTRRSSNERFVFARSDGAAVSKSDLKRIAELSIPPAWTNVQIATDRNAHLQAIGRDAAGRLQYIYHAAWEDIRAETKFTRLLELGKSLNTLRQAIGRDLVVEDMQSLAAPARLIERLHLRAGHECYAGDEGGRGAATLLKRHVRLDSSAINLRFRGKGGKVIAKSLDDPKLAEALRLQMTIRGVRLFKLKSDKGYRAVTAADVNAYMAGVAGRSISAKDFRTLFASAYALDRLSKVSGCSSSSARRRAVKEVSKEISVELTNTPAVVRGSYIHPAVLEAFETGALNERPRVRARKGQSLAETRLMRFLESRAVNEPA